MDVDRLPRTPEHWTIGEDWFMLPRNADQIDAVLAWLVPAGFGLQVETHGKLYVHSCGARRYGRVARAPGSSRISTQDGPGGCEARRTGKAVRRGVHLH